MGTQIKYDFTYSTRFKLMRGDGPHKTPRLPGDDMRELLETVRAIKAKVDALCYSMADAMLAERNRGK